MPRSKVRKALPEDFAYILEELLSYDDSPDRKRYYERIIDTIIEIDSAEAFVIELCNLIQRLAIDCLHIIGDSMTGGRAPMSSWILCALPQCRRAVGQP